MRRRPHFTRRTRLRLALLALCALLFQQMALAAYACPLPASATAMAPMTAMASMPGCAGMPQMDAHGTQLCAQHCAQQAPAPQDARLPAVPALALPPQPPVLVVAASLQSPRFDDRAAADLDGSPPPRSCVLLI
ncbi:MAG: hypothetical protein KGI40_10250 [Xanthomonadaceae bacterium]|nr:hypothetical protein [Xanthomonadaceae bacterium]MDE2177762.1 hypothetical protein [Xanthomonadaceae bacterium]